MKKYIYSMIFAVSIPVGAVYQTISQAGSITLGDDIAYDPGVTTNDAIFYISASNVTIDLGARVLSQIGSTAGLRGVEIASGVTNVEIKNGTISGATGAGVYVNPGCTNIILSELEIVSTGTRGIELAGSAISPIEDCQIQHCEILYAGTSLSAIGILLSQCNKIRITETVINDCGGTGLAFVGCRLTSCADCDLAQVSLVSNIGTTFTGFDIVSTSRCSFTNCVVRNNVFTSTLSGFDLNGAANTNNIFQNCSVVRNTGTTVNGFNLQANSQANVLKECIVLANSGTTALNGVQLSGGAANNFNNTLLECLVQNNSASTGDCIGYNVNGSDFGLIKACIASFNTATATVAAGLQFTTGTGGANWYVQDSQFVRNSGVNTASSFGVRIQTGATNWFANNIAFNNGTTSGNQLSGIAIGATTSRNTTNVNTTNGTTNIAGIP